MNLCTYIIYMYVYIYINMCVHIHLAYSTFQLTHFVSLQSWSPRARSRASRGCSLAWSASKRCPVEGPLDCHELTTGMDRKYQMIKQLTCGHTHWLDMGWDYPIKSKNVVHAHPHVGSVFSGSMSRKRHRHRPRCWCLSKMLKASVYFSRSAAVSPSPSPKSPGAME